MTDNDDSQCLTQPSLLKQQEVADMFKCKARTIRNWDRRGLLNPIRVGRSVFYQRDEVERLAREGSHKEAYFQQDKYTF